MQTDHCRDESVPSVSLLPPITVGQQATILDVHPAITGDQAAQNTLYIFRSGNRTTDCRYRQGKSGWQTKLCDDSSGCQVWPPTIGRYQSSVLQHRLAD